MLRNITQRSKKHLYSMLTLQCIVTLVSLPILIAWGLPISMMTFIGNILLVPIVTLLLFFSTLLFFAHFLYIPCSLIGWCMNSTTSILNYLLSFGSPLWLIGFAKPPLIILFCVTGCSLYFVWYLHRKYDNTLLLLSFVLTINILFYASYTQLQRMLNSRITIWPGFVITKEESHTFIIHDYGSCGRKKSVDKFATYQLTPRIIQALGTCRFDKIVLHKPSARSLEMAQSLRETFTIKP